MQQFSIDEARAAIGRQALMSALAGQYLVVMSYGPDTIISDEPYFSLMLLINTSSGKYIRRMWNRTVAQGEVTTIEQIVELCKIHFYQGRPCIGYPTVEINDAFQGYIISQTPVPRKISKLCHGVLSTTAGTEANCCPECYKLVGDGKEHDRIRLDDTEAGSDEEKVHPFAEVVEEEFESDENKDEVDPQEDAIEPRQDWDTGANQLQNIEKVSLHEVESQKGDIEGHQLQNDKLQCEWCDKVLTSHWGYTSHKKKWHAWGNFKCSECNFKAHFSIDLIKHKRETEKHISTLDIDCPLCKKSCSHEEIDSHYKTCYRQRLKRNEKKDYVCNICGKVLKSRSSFAFHKKSHLRADGVSDLQAGTTLYYYCEKCGSKFTGRKALNHHVRSVHNEEKYPCSKCPEVFKTHSILLKHKIVIHSKDEKYNCKHCGLRIGELSQLKAHERSHEDPKFKCRFCSKMIKSKTALESHERIHTGEKPFPCSICSAGFTSNSGLGQHMRGVHKIAARGGKLGWQKKPK